MAPAAQPRAIHPSLVTTILAGQSIAPVDPLVQAGTWPPSTALVSELVLHTDVKLLRAAYFMIVAFFILCQSRVCPVDSLFS
jgi:hypothetical protein